jgi:hypothetical protein
MLNCAGALRLRSRRLVPSHQRFVLRTISSGVIRRRGLTLLAPDIVASVLDESQSAVITLSMWS